MLSINTPRHVGYTLPVASSVPHHVSNLSLSLLCLVAVVMFCVVGCSDRKLEVHRKRAEARAPSLRMM